MQWTAVPYDGPLFYDNDVVAEGHDPDEEVMPLPEHMKGKP